MTTFTHPDNASEGHRWQTRDGRDVRIVCTDAKGGWPIVALVSTTWRSHEVVQKYRADGNFYNTSTSDHDLIDAPKPKRVIEGWVNVYDGVPNSWASIVWSSEDEAKSTRASEPVFARVYIRAEKGEGL